MVGGFIDSSGFWLDDGGDQSVRGVQAVSSADGLNDGGQWSVISGQWSVISGQFSVISGQ